MNLESHKPGLPIFTDFSRDDVYKTCVRAMVNGQPFCKHCYTEQLKHILNKVLSRCFNEQLKYY